MALNIQGCKDNARHIMGNLVGLIYLKSTGTRFTKDQRGCYWVSTIAANCAANNVVETVWFPYTMII